MRRYRSLAALLAGCAVLVGIVGVSSALGGSGWRLSQRFSHHDLTGVACTGTATCVAVSPRTRLGVARGETEATVEVLDHGRWSAHHPAAFRSKDLSGQSPTAGPVAVSCRAEICVAVGSSATGATERPAAARFEAGKWSTISPHGKASAKSTFLDVSCGSDTSCMALGSGRDDAALAEHWNGTSWTRTHLLNTGTKTGAVTQPTGISCPTATDCWGVFIHYGSSRADLSATTSTITKQEFSEHWNGKRWTRVAFARPDSNSADAGFALSGISCPSVHSCVAVGEASTVVDGTVVVRALSERSNGRAWHLGPQPPIRKTGSVLVRVSCVSSSDCVAVGQSGTGTSRPLAGRLRNGHWTTTVAPQPKRADGSLHALDCTSAKSCFAVGSWLSGDWFESFVDRL